MWRFPDQRSKKRWRRVFAEPIDPNADHETHLRAFEVFVRVQLGEQAGRWPSWSAHIENWSNAKSRDVLLVSYENLRSDTNGQLRRCMDFTNTEVDDEQVQLTVDSFEFARLTGREPGVQDGRSFLRKGISGDWKNYFSKESAQLFDDVHGEMLIRLGYEPDRSWLESTEFVSW